jgi:hypothetical protein
MQRVEHLGNVIKYCILIPRCCYNIVGNSHFIALMYCLSSFTTCLRQAQQQLPLFCFKLIISSVKRLPVNPSVMIGNGSDGFERIKSKIAAGTNSISAMKFCCSALEPDVGYSRKFLNKSHASFG